MSAKAKEAAAEGAVLNYLQVQNRPFSVADIMLNLHQEYGKTAIQKALDKWVKEDRVVEKTYGKQKVYWINQNLVSELGSTERKEMDQLIEAKEKIVKEAEAGLKEAIGKLKEVTNSLPTPELKEQIATMEQKYNNLKTKVDVLSTAAAGQTVDKKEIQNVRNALTHATKKWKAKKRAVIDVVEQAIEEMGNKTRKDMFEEIGIEDDEV